jgi:2',3'-cyclic-nucleotide 2'-phosphodiesterase (5'-nucleotidase family)
MIAARTLTVLAVAATSVLATAQKSPDVGAHLPSQAAADVIREAAGADGAFLAAGLVNERYQQNNLATLLQYPDDPIVIVALKGAQVRQAFEKSLALYPQPNTSFLQVSGFEITFSPDAPSGQQVKSVTTSEGPLDDSKTYNIAMPASLGRGGLGYFKIWDKTKIVSTLSVTVEKALLNKSYVETRPRWVALQR